MTLRCKTSRCGVKSETAVFVCTEKLLTAVMVVRSIFLPLYTDFLSVFEGEPYIILAEDGDEVHQPTPKDSIEFIYQVSLRQGSQKGFDGSPSGLDRKSVV